MTHRDRAGDPSGQRAGQRAGGREAAGDAGHRQGFPTPAHSPAAGSPARSLWVIINAPWYHLSARKRRGERDEKGWRGICRALPEVG